MKMAMSEPRARLSAHNLKKRYKARTVVADVSFQVESGRSEEHTSELQSL